MPYYITDKSPDCPSWAVVKTNGDLVACHPSKKSAIDQAVAISLSEGEEFVGERNANGDPIIISDIDDTLLRNGDELIQKTYNYIQSLDGQLFLVTGRPSSTREKTVGDLRRAGVRYSRLIMNPGSTADSASFKKSAAENLLETYNVIKAIENDDTARGYYSDLGISTINPSSISESTVNRAAVGQLKIGDYVTWDVTDPDILAEVLMVEGELAVLELYELDDDVYKSTDKLLVLNIFRLIRIPRPEKIAQEIPDQLEIDNNLDDSPDSMDQTRAVNLEPPAYMRAAARRGLEYYAKGKGGDGLVDRTIREARAMAEGNVTADKWVRIAAWIARHLGDLDSPDANPSSPNYPSAGVVAHLLWGSGPSKASANRALNYAQGVVARLEEENRATISQESEKMAKIEQRTNTANFELRAVEGSDGMTFTGYAAVFNSPSEPLPFIERIAPGAFKRSLRARNDIKLLWNHDTGQVLGSTRAGTLKLEEDNYGLRVTAVLPDTQLGRDVRTLVQRGDVNAMSFGFSVPANGDSWNTDGTERTLRSVRIHEVSIVAFPAYSQTSGTAAVRSFDTVATRAEVDADQLADAMLAIEDGKDLTLEQSELLTKVIQRLTPQQEAELAQENGDLTALELKKKKIELLLKRF